MTIPYRERGYSVEPTTLIVHERYQQHAIDVRRTSVAGMYNMVGTNPVGCPVCFPPPPEMRRPAREEVDDLLPAMTEILQAAKDAVPEPTISEGDET